VDDGDGAQDPDVIAANLAAWRERALAPHPPDDDPVALAWADTRACYRIPLRYAEQLIEGVAADLGAVRYATFDDLAAYCYGVASTVGLMSMHIIGFSGPEAIPYAVKLGVALQLTNILRDVAEDWRMGRLYLPLDELAAYGLGEGDIARLAAHPVAPPLVAHPIAPPPTVHPVAPPPTVHPVAPPLVGGQGDGGSAAPCGRPNGGGVGRDYDDAQPLTPRASAPDPQPLVPDSWRAFIAFQIARNRQLYAEAMPGIRLLHPDGRFAIAAAAELYRGILDDIEAHGGDVFSRRAHLSGQEKLRRLPGIWRRASKRGF